MKKSKFLKISSTILIVGFYLFLAYGSENSESKDSKSSIDCSKNADYKEGYASGQLVKMLGGTSTCEGYVDKYNYETGINYLSATECFCEGFRDGRNGEQSKYREMEINANENTNTENYNSINSSNKEENIEYTNLPAAEKEKFALKDNLENFYNEINNSNLDASKYFSKVVTQFINLKNITPEQINRLYNEEKEYINPNIKIYGDIDYSNFENDIQYYTYWIDYSCYRVSKKKYQKCKIFIEIGMSENGIVSLKELRLKDLTFSDTN